MSDRTVVEPYRQLSSQPNPEATMDKDRIAGTAKKTKGSLKEAIGKVTGDRKTQAEGAAEKTTGTAETAVGSVKDTIRDAAKPR